MQIESFVKIYDSNRYFYRENIFKAVYLVSDNEIGFKIGHGKTPKPFKILAIRLLRDLTQFDPRHANLIISRPFDKI